MKSNFIILSFILLFSCNDSSQKKRILPENTGKLNEIILVIKDKEWEGPIGKILKNTFQIEIPGLPQSERLFN